ncbi:hypothetical protein [Legionella pneumophila]|uniref:hypothetical protein n=1 Tax=Legionella pneumophila TaxID=446 RepID=UPI001F3C46A2|nr:hypothetical protein [Legionella pneumophila]
MKIYLVQHSDSLDKDIDPERPLSDQSQKDIQLLSIYALFIMCIIGYSNLLSDK